MSRAGRSAVARARKLKAVGIAGVLLAPLAGSLTATSAIAAPSVAAAPPASASAPPAPVPVLTWETCFGEVLPGRECATATVPLDYDKPAKGTIDVAMLRVPATNPGEKIGTLFLNPGGPGGSGVEFALFAGDLIDSLLGGRFDIVGFDPRGVGFSDPLYCFESRAQLDALLGDQPVFPYIDSDHRAKYFQAYRKIEAFCRAQKVPIFAQMSTADVARDMDMMRQAVGDAKINYLGFSYGSFLGQVYANLFPKNIRTLVIDGVLDPKLWTTGKQIKSDRVATKVVLGEFFRLCDEAAEVCAFSGPSGSEARWEAMRQALFVKPLVLGFGGFTFTYTYDFLISDATSAMYSADGWAPFAAYLDELDRARLGDAAAAQRAYDARTALHAIWYPNHRTDYPNYLEGFYGVYCADTEFPSSWTEFYKISKWAEKGSEFGGLWWWQSAACAQWEVSDDRYMGPWNAKTSAPVLVVGNYFDPSTDYAGAKAAAKLLPNSRLLTYAGWGHTAYLTSGCATDHINTYLLTGKVPAKNTVCPANPSPFLASPQAPTAGGAGGPAIVPGTPPWWLQRGA